MREIKFRQAIYSNNKFDYWHYWGFMPDLSFIGPDMINGIAHALINSGHFTGLHDKNGKEDWINDIAETYVGNIKYRRRIFQSEISGAYCINLPTLGSTSGEEAIMLCTCEHTNIGNIHETPELMESDNG